MNRAIYCISGMGADEKAFINLQVNGYELKFIPWIRPHKNERIEHYAERMAKYIKHDSPILLGLSFGGMVSIEIAKQMPVKKIVYCIEYQIIFRIARLDESSSHAETA